MTRLALIYAAVLAAAEAAGAARPVHQIELAGSAISPVTARFIERSIAAAGADGASALVIVLDTPGGLVDSTRQAVRGLLDADVPVIVFVPAGGHAASAGMFLVLAGHVAAMAPGSNIGAAHPVELGGGLPINPSRPAEGDDERESEAAPETASPLGDKVVNDTAAWARALAELRGRNAEWAASAVRESSSVTADEALALGVIDLVAANPRELLDRVDGRQVALAERTVTLETRAAPIRIVEMWWGDQFLAVVSNPNLAFLLLIFGFYGILFEFYSPGWGVAGTLGVISLVIAFFALAVLPISYVGLALVALAIALFVAEAFLPSFGALTVGGVLCLVLGGLMLVDSPAGFLRVSLDVVVPVAVATALVVVFLLTQIVRAHRAPVQSGSEALVGLEATVGDEFTETPEGWVGTVRVYGEYWRATSNTPVHAGDRVEVDHRENLTLLVSTGTQAVASGHRVDP